MRKVYIAYDFKFLVTTILLLLIGMLLIYDASVAYSLITFGNKYYFLLKHIAWIVIGLIGFSFFTFIDLRILQKYSLLLFIVTVLFLVLVLIPTPFAPSVYGARRWLIINPPPLPQIPLIGTLSFQPSELAKLTSIIYLSSLLTSSRLSSNELTKNLNFIVLLILVCGLILLQPNYSTSLIVAGSLFVVYFISGANLKILFTQIPIFLSLAIVYAFSSSYRRDRILTLLSNDDTLDASYHVKQILIALGSGGLFGLGLGSSVQKYAYLPEVTADSIFAILGEELGFIGASFLVLLYIYLIWRGFKIAANAKDSFTSLVAYGIISWISIQVIVNLFAMIKFFPITGIPLPLVSYGGSSTVILLFALGIMFNVSKMTLNERSVTP